jgi:OmpA-OmpF porin, OOP family
MKKLFLLGVFICISQVGNAQLFKDFGKKLEDKAKKKLEQKAEQKTDRHIDKTLDKADKKTDEKIEDIKNNKKSSSDSESASSSKKSKEIKGAKDFVSGTKILASEDFSQDALGDFPVNMTSNTSGEVVEMDKQKWLSLAGNGAFTIKNFNKDLPEDFTFEFDLANTDGFGWKSKELGIVFASSKNGKKDYIKWGENKHDANGLKVGLHPRDFSSSSIGATRFFTYEGGKETMKNEKTQNQYTNSKNPVRVQLWRQKSRLRVYVNGAKIWDVQEAFGELKYNTIAFVLGDYENDAQHYLITNLKLAEAGADTRHKLIETGTFSTSEILFDTNKATIKSSSEKILAELGEALKLTPEFKVMIIGHTDGDGKETDNQKLSEKRAESVKNHLVSKFGIDVSRIQTSGKGESQPLADNTSEDGKAKNRRVEFKKM